jgi:hypothetical protein
MDRNRRLQAHPQCRRLPRSLDEGRPVRLGREVNIHPQMRKVQRPQTRYFSSAERLPMACHREADGRKGFARGVAYREGHGGRTSFDLELWNRSFQTQFYCLLNCCARLDSDRVR